MIRKQLILSREVIRSFRLGGKFDFQALSAPITSVEADGALRRAMATVSTPEASVGEMKPSFGTNKII